MINYEIKKIFSGATIKTILSIIMIIFIISTVYMAKGINNTNEIYDGHDKYSEEVYEEIKQKHGEYILEIMENHEDSIKLKEIGEKYSSVVMAYPVYEKIHNRIDNIRIFQTYNNWNSDLKYTYDKNETYEIENFTGWENFIINEWFFIASFLSVIVVSIAVCCSDNNVGNKKVIYSTKAGKEKIIDAKKTTILSFAAIFTLGYFVLQLVIYMLFGLKLSLLDAGLYQVQGFELASSYTSIGKYLFFELLGLLVLNLFAALFVYFSSTILNKHVYIYVITAFAIIIAIMLKDFSWITPANFYEPKMFFDNINEISIGNVVLSKYFINIIVTVVLTVLLTIVGNYINKKTEED